MIQALIFLATFIVFFPFFYSLTENGLIALVGTILIWFIMRYAFKYAYKHLKNLLKDKLLKLMEYLSKLNEKFANIFNEDQQKLIQRGESRMLFGVSLVSIAFILSLAVYSLLTDSNLGMMGDGAAMLAESALILGDGVATLIGGITEIIKGVFFLVWDLL